MMIWDLTLAFWTVLQMLKFLSDDFFAYDLGFVIKIDQTDGE